MRKGCVVLFAGLLLLTFAALAVSVALHEADPTTRELRRQELAYWQQRDAQDLAERASSAQWWAQFRTTLLPVAVTGAAGLALLGLAAVGVAGWMAVDTYRRRRWLVWPDEHGQVPLPYDGVVAGQYAELSAGALAGWHAGEIERKKQPAIPANVERYTDSRKYVEGRPAPAQLATPAQAQLATPEPISVPTFAKLLTDGQIGQPGRLLLGYSEAGPLWGGWKDLYSSAVAGLQGSGKTTTVRFLAAQSAAQGARFVIIDPHAGAENDSLAATLAPLAPSFIADPATGEEAIRAIVSRVWQEFDARKSGRRGPPLIVCIDEFTSLMRSRVGMELAHLVEAVAQEGRKYGVYCLLSGQIWNVERSGGAPVRDALASAYVHRSKPQQARLLLPGAGQEVLKLPVGHAILDRTNGERLTVAIPNTRATDLVSLGEWLAHSVVTSSGSASQPAEVASQDGAEGLPAGSNPEIPPDHAEIIARLRAGQTPHQIVKELFGVTSGRAYQRRRFEVQTLIARYMPADIAAAGE